VKFSSKEAIKLQNNQQALIRHIRCRLDQNSEVPPDLSANPVDLSGRAAVMMLISYRRDRRTNLSTPFLVLNKRSHKVAQPGDLCCPGGRVAPILDEWFQKILTLPGLPVIPRAYRTLWRLGQNGKVHPHALLLATGLRECLEEMRLNPFGVRFLGPLPPQPLQMFQRIIYPMVGWIPNQKRFFPNWEVEEIVFLSLRSLLAPEGYSRFRLRLKDRFTASDRHKSIDYPCFVHQHRNETELLWGATYRIVTAFIELVFGFRPPNIATLPVVPKTLPRAYLKTRPKRCNSHHNRLDKCLNDR
jgi:hypothetical protein